MEYCVCFFTFGISLVFKRMVWGLLVVLSYVMWRVWHLWGVAERQINKLMNNFLLFLSTCAFLILTLPHFPSPIAIQLRGKWETGRKKDWKKADGKKAERVFFSIWGIKISKISQKNQATQVEGRMNRKFYSVLSVLGWHLLFKSKC